MMHGINRLTVLLVLAAVLTGWSCSKGGGSSSTRLRIGLSPEPSYALIELAEKRGHFTTAGLDAEIVRFDSEEATMRALEKGDVTVACLGAEEVLDLASRGVGARLFLATEVSQGTAAIVSKEDWPEVKRIRGQSVGYVPGSLAHLLLRFTLKYEGIMENDVRLVELTDTEIPAALADGRVVAAAVQDRVLIELLAGGGLHEVISTRDHTDIQINGLVALDDVRAARKAELELLVRVWMLALADARSDTAASVKAVAGSLGVSPETAEAMLARLELGGRDTNERVFGITMRSSGKDGLHEYARFLRGTGRLERVPKSELCLDDSLLGPMIGGPAGGQGGDEQDG